MHFPLEEQNVDQSQSCVLHTSSSSSRFAQSSEAWIHIKGQIYVQLL